MTETPSPVPAPAVGAQAPPISRAIYGMPMFATLQARDLAATVSWYTDGLGFINLFTMPGPDGAPLLVHLRRWQFQDLLVRPARGPATPADRIARGPGTPGSTCQLSFAAVYGELDALAERARAHAAGRVDGPADTPWNTRDLTATDPDGQVVVFTAARPPELADPAFTDRMRRAHADTTRASRHTGQVGRGWQLSRKRHQRLHQEHLAGAAS
jgi:catechol 2,3-dioxygenase-like lactoylglutathione lyase family enzyme